MTKGERKKFAVRRWHNTCSESLNFDCLPSTKQKWISFKIKICRWEGRYLIAENRTKKSNYDKSNWPLSALRKGHFNFSKLPLNLKTTLWRHQRLHSGNSVQKTHCLVGSCPVNIYLFQVNNGNIRKRCEICSKLAIYTLEQCQPCPLESSEIITFFSVSTVDFEQVNICWVD